MTSRLLAFLLLVAGSVAASAQSDMGTPEQRKACAPDVGRFCKAVKPEDGPFAYLDCLQKHSDKLRPACLTVIQGGSPEPEPRRR